MPCYSASFIFIIRFPPESNIMEAVTQKMRKWRKIFDFYVVLFFCLSSFACQTELVKWIQDTLGQSLSHVLVQVENARLFGWSCRWRFLQSRRISSFTSVKQTVRSFRRVMYNLCQPFSVETNWMYLVSNFSFIDKDRDQWHIELGLSQKKLGFLCDKVSFRTSVD